MRDVRYHLQVIIMSLEKLTKEEHFPVYAEVYNKYVTALSQYERSEDLLELNKNIAHTTRMLLEAPANNEALGLKILEEITALYAAM